MSTKNLILKTGEETKTFKKENFKWGFDPFLSLVALKMSVDELFSEIFPTKASLKREPLVSPKTDAYTHDGKYYIEIDLPGVEKKDIRFHLTGSHLILHAKQYREIKIDQNNLHLQERVLGIYTKSLPLQAAVNPSKFSAILKNGVLKIICDLKK